MTTDHLIITEPRRKSALVTAIILSNVITMLNAGSVNIAMPVLMESFQANLNQVQWVMLAYILTLACAMPLVTALSERYSYRKVFLNCLIIIGILSLACAFASNLWML
ncbi:MAG: MFS transporter, partial [Clostridia bacterium]|nr:MFS transporter [Clostridia bacterium]